MSTATTTTKVHKFELANLGVAPFEIVGEYEKRGPQKSVSSDGVEISVGAPGQPMGTCAYCGNSIALCFVIRSADGREFVVGSDCVLKTGDAGLKRVVAAHTAKAAKERDAARARATRERFESGELDALFVGAPDPKGIKLTRWTPRDWVEFNLYRAGRTGCMRAVRYVDGLERAAKLDDAAKAVQS